MVTIQGVFPFVSVFLGHTCRTVEQSLKIWVKVIMIIHANRHNSLASSWHACVIVHIIGLCLPMRIFLPFALSCHCALDQLATLFYNSFTKNLPGTAGRGWCGGKILTFKAVRDNKTLTQAPVRILSQMKAKKIHFSFRFNCSITENDCESAPRQTIHTHWSFIRSK